jgi:tetratricopeptide (TPR) repeat protein
LDMPANTEWDFTQVFGASQVDSIAAYQESWGDAREYIEEQLEHTLHEDQVYAIHDRLKALADRPPEVILHVGSGWGALEGLRREKLEKRTIPQGFDFSEQSIGAQQFPWLELLTTGVFPESGVSEIPASWMVQDEWIILLQESLKTKENENWTVFMHYGVMLYEQGLEDEALAAWEKSLLIQPSAWVYRNLAEMKQQRKEKAVALFHMEQGYAVSNGFPDIAFMEEYLNLLILNNHYEKAWNFYESLPLEFSNSDRMQIIIGEAALQLNKYSFMERLFITDFAIIREGEQSIIKLWYKYKAKKLAESRNVELSKELMSEVIKQFPPPANIDFRMG